MRHQKFLKMLKPKPALFILQLSCLRILSVLWLMWHFQPKQPPRRAVRLCCVRTGERECIRECAYVYVWAREWELCVQCRNVAGHRQLWNFPIKSQYVSIGCLGFVGWLVFFFFCPLPSSFISIYERREREGQVEKCSQAPPSRWRSRAVPTTGGARRRGAEQDSRVVVPGDRGRGSPRCRGSCGWRGPFKVLQQQPEVWLLFFERTGEIINHSWWRQSWSD